MAAALTTADLERASGLPRSTIQFYTRQGLLPPPQKTVTGRSLYSQDHLTLLRRISALKDEGHPLSWIKEHLQDDVAKLQNDSPDLESEEWERVHASILRVATEKFVEYGYRGTHVAAVIDELGINPHVFYSHFPGKLALLVECFDTFLRWNTAHVRPKVMSTNDLGERLLRKVAASSRADQLGADLLAAIRLQGPTENPDPYRLSEMWADIVRLFVRDMESAVPAGAPPLPVPVELIAYSFIGAHRNASARASWDDAYGKADLFRTQLFMFLAVVAALRGDVDVASQLARYEPLISDLVSHDPDLPPAIDDEPSGPRTLTEEVSG